MREVKPVSAKQGQNSIILGVLIVHILFLIGVYVLIYHSSVIDFEAVGKLAVSGNVLWAKIKEKLSIAVGILVLGCIFFGKSGKAVIAHHSVGTENRPGLNSLYVFVNDKGSHNGEYGYWLH